MKVRILDAGFKNYTGQFGAVDFVNGVSDDISRAEAERLGAILQIEDADTGRNPAVTQLMVEMHDKNLAEMGLTRTVGRQGVEKAEQPKLEDASAFAKAVMAPPKVEVVLSYDYTEEDLDLLIKKEGIAGLRAFAEPYGVKGKAIPAIVRALLALKAEKNPVPAIVAAEVVETVVEDAPIIVGAVEVDIELEKGDVEEPVVEVVEEDDVVVEE